MKHANAYEKYDDLSTENMEKAVQVMDACLVENGIDYQKRTQARMLLEKILTEYAGICQDAPFRLLIHRSVKNIRVRLYVKCESFNVMEECEGFFDEISSGDREAPLEWKYSRGRNVLTCTM